MCSCRLWPLVITSGWWSGAGGGGGKTSHPNHHTPATKHQSRLELRHSRIALGADALAKQDQLHRSSEDLQVEPEGPRLDVTHVPLEFFIPRKRIAPFHLSQSRDARLHF